MHEVSLMQAALTIALNQAEAQGARQIHPGWQGIRSRA
mgnify:CR=1 FL=1